MNKVDFENALNELFKDIEERHWRHVIEYNDIYNQIEIVQDGEWIDDGKYSYLEDCIIKNKETGDFYEINQERSVSYWSDYFYTDITFYQV